MASAPDFESGGWGFESLRDRFAIQYSAIGLVVKYLVANEVPRVRFPDGASSSCGAVGSASVLCADGPGFEPLQEHFLCLAEFNCEQSNTVASHRTLIPW